MPNPFKDFADIGWVKRAMYDPRVINNDDGSDSSVLTGFRTEINDDGEWEILVYPHIRDVGGKLQQLDPDAAFAAARERDDFIRLPVGQVGGEYGTPEIKQAEELAQQMTSGFSEYLGSEEVVRKKAALRLLTRTSGGSVELPPIFQRR